MRLIRVKAYQPMACYRKPFSYGFWDTYPLPPFSTILGWVHWVIGENAREEKLPMTIGVAGIFDSISLDLQKLKKFDRVRRNKVCKQCGEEYDEKKKKCPKCESTEVASKTLKNPENFLPSFGSTLGETVTYVANITHINLRIYLQMEETFLVRFQEKALSVNYPSLGRYEDLMRIDAVEFIEPQRKEFDGSEELIIDYPLYLKPEIANDEGIKGSNFQIPFQHKLIDGIRYFTKENVVFSDSGTISYGHHWLDLETDEFFKHPVLVQLFGNYSP